MTRALSVLFVDDEQRILDGLQRSLRSQQSVWRMHFARGAVAATDLVHAIPMDVVISDMRMPGTDGAEFLEEVSRLQPAAARIVLSGHGEPGELLRGLRTSHRYLGKPIDSVALRRGVEDLAELYADLGTAMEVVAAPARLPASPRAMNRLQDALAGSRGRLQDASEVLAGVPGVGLGVLHLLHGGFLRGVAPPGFEQALATLAPDLMWPLLDGEVLHRPASAAEVGRIAAIEQHARVAARLVTQLGDPHPAGLDLMACVASMAGDLLGAVSAAESGRLGAALCQLWGLPPVIVRAVGSWHRSPLSLDLTDLGTRVHVARGLAAEVAPAPGVFTDAALLARMGTATELAKLRAIARAATED